MILISYQYRISTMMISYHHWIRIISGSDQDHYLTKKLAYLDNKKKCMIGFLSAALKAHLIRVS